MSEPERERRKSNGAWGRLLGPSIGIGAVAVALIMVLSPSAGAVSPGTTLTAPFKGSVEPFSYADIQGCGKNTVTKAAGFDAKTGAISTAATSSSTACPKKTAPIGGSYSDFEGGVELGLSFKTKVAATSVNLTAAWKGSVAMSVSDGLPAGTTASCSAAWEIYDYHYDEYSWNYTPATGFASYNYSYSDVGNYFTGYSYAYGTGPIPKPFHLNSTTYRYIDIFKDKDRTCQSYDYLQAYTYASLLDTNTLSSWTGSSSNSAITEPFAADMEIYNQTDYQCSEYDYWYGPTNTSIGSLNYSCSWYNSTTQSELYVYSPTASSSVGTNNSLSLSMALTGTGSYTFAGTFPAHQTYELIFEFYVFGDTGQSWTGGSANAAFNFGTAGNGFDLKSVTIT